MPALSSFDTQHEDMIHDAQIDYFGKKLATCSSDKTIKLHQIEGQQHTLVDTLKGHEGPVWQVTWSHPKFGGLLASCSYDGKVLIWKQENDAWQIIYTHSVHTASVNTIAWSPVEFGLNLACGSSDGKVSVLTWKEDGTWSSPAIFTAHQLGVNALSWAPSSVPTALIQPTVPAASQVKRLVTGGSDNLVKIWRQDPQDAQWQLEQVLEGHSDWVRDVQWAPNLGFSNQLIASCSQDKTVLIWSLPEGSQQWIKKLLKEDKFPDVLWKVSWSIAGNLLAVSGGDNKVTLWKQNLDGQWENVSELEDQPAVMTGK